MTASQHRGSSGFIGAASRLITLWALLGGGVLLVVVGVNMLTIISGQFGKPFPGDFELTEMGVAIAVFSFLPYCQLSGANVSADIFTASAPPRVVAFFTLLGSVVALGFAFLLIWRMYLGLLDQKTYDYTTTILQIPHWMAFVPILISLAFLALAAFVTLIRDVSALSKG